MSCAVEIWIWVVWSFGDLSWCICCAFCCAFVVHFVVHLLCMCCALHSLHVDIVHLLGTFTFLSHLALDWDWNTLHCSRFALLWLPRKLTPGGPRNEVGAAHRRAGIPIGTGKCCSGGGRCVCVYFVNAKANSISLLECQSCQCQCQCQYQWC